MGSAGQGLRPVCWLCEDRAEWYLDAPDRSWSAWACSSHAARIWSSDPTLRLIPAAAACHYRAAASF